MGFITLYHFKNSDFFFLGRFQALNEEVTDIKVSPDSLFLAVAGQSGTIRCWNFKLIRQVLFQYDQSYFLTQSKLRTGIDKLEKLKKK